MRVRKHTEIEEESEIVHKEENGNSIRNEKSIILKHRARTCGG